LQEIWKLIDGYEDYFVSNLGRVKSTKNNKIKYLKLILNGCGYYQVGLFQNGKSKSISVHRLIAEAFIDNLNNHPYVDHIDGNKLNNNLDNLRWVTHQENLFNTKAKGYCWDKKAKKWRSYIMISNKIRHLGYFDNEEDARQAYLDAKKIYHIID